MATNYTTLLGLALPTTGELDGTWGTTVNNSITQLVEDSIAETATASVSAGDWTLSTTGSGATNEARCAILIPTGTPGTSRNIIAPAKSKAYYVINRSDGSVVVKTSASTGVTVAAGAKATVAYDTSISDFVEVAPTGTGGTVTSVAVSGGTTGLTTSGGPITSSGTITIAGTLAVANGGTGSTTASGARTALGLGDLAILDTVGTNEIDNAAITPAKLSGAQSGSAPAYAVRAWMRYNADTPAVNASGNVSSVTIAATGGYLMNFSTSMPDANYAVAGFAVDTNTYKGIVGAPDDDGTNTSTTSRIFITVVADSTLTALSPNRLSIMVIR